MIYVKVILVSDVCLHLTLTQHDTDTCDYY